MRQKFLRIWMYVFVYGADGVSREKNGNSREYDFLSSSGEMGKWARKKNYELQGTYRPIKFTNLDVNATDGAENV